MCKKTETPCNTRIKLQEAKEENKQLRMRLDYTQNKLIDMQSELLLHLNGAQDINQTLNHLINIAKR